MADSGAGEILLTNCDRDGTMTGYDIEMISKVSESVSVPVIASGGAGSAEDFIEAFNAGAQAVAAGSIFHFTQLTPRMIKEALSSAGVPVRIGI